MRIRGAITKAGRAIPPRLAPWAGYGLALLIPCLAAALQHAILPDPSIAPFVLLYLAVTLVSWLAGTRPGLVATALSGALGNFLFLTPTHELTLHGPALTATLLFLPTAAAIAALCGSLRSSQLLAQLKAVQLRRFELLVEHSREILLFIRRLDGRIIDANRAALEAYGYARDQLLALSILDLRAPGERETASQQLARADAAGLVFEAVHCRRDGTRFPVEVSTRGASIGAEQLLVSVVRDITERKRAEAAVFESEERFRGVVENMPDAVTLYDETRRVAYVNPAFERIAGLASCEVVGKRSEEVWPVAAVPRLQVLLETAFAAGVRVADEYTAQTRAGQTVTREVVQVPLRGSDGVVRQVLAIGHDVTEERRMLEALRDMNRRKDEFLAMLSHELRNPLMPIRNSIHILRRAGLGAEQSARALTVIDRQSAHMTRMVNDLLDLNRIGRNAISIRRGRVELNALARRIADDYASAFASAGVTLEVTTAPEPVVVEGDEERLVQVVGNLLQNAAKFTRAGGRASLQVRRTNGDAEVSVSDTGVGLTPEMIARLFEPFTQADRTLDRSKGGLGLGLALSKSIVELHGGRLTASSEGADRGSRFVVRLPRALD